MLQQFHCKKKKDHIGVIIAQLGTPDEPTPSALRRYLKQFLADRRVIEVNRVLWWLLLNIVILQTRPKRSARLYKRLWREDGSPLFSISKKQVAGISAHLSSESEKIHCVLGMRYGNPSMESAIDNLIELGCDKIVVYPMYPQYAGPTTASTYDAVFKHLMTKRHIPTVKIVPPYYNHRLYIESLCHRIHEYWESCPEDKKPERILLSYHGVPESYVKKGDPYCCHCVETSSLIKKYSNLNPDIFIHTFQSLFGREKWLTPYTEGTLEKLAAEGIKRVAVICPGFTADCLETIDEVGHEAKEVFVEAGGESLHLIPCLNDHPFWIQAMASMIKDELNPWLLSDTLSASASACPSGLCGSPSLSQISSKA